AIVLTTATVVVAGLTYFQLPQTLTWLHLVVGGVILSLCGQLGDLMLSSIKRDIGIKDTGSLIPGHGGLLDRIDSLILTSPAAFHFLGYFGGLRPDEHIRILTG
ncbi:MAG: phosphatidate cytidylyltransferase, partial [Phycisphaerales bacterium JB043]